MGGGVEIDAPEGHPIEAHGPRVMSGVEGDGEDVVGRVGAGEDAPGIGGAVGGETGIVGEISFVVIKTDAECRERLAVKESAGGFAQVVEFYGCSRAQRWQ